MNKVCPLCKGKLTIPAHNGVTESAEHQTCPVCGGVGEVDEQRQENKPIVIYKYWGTFSSES